MRLLLISAILVVACGDEDTSIKLLRIEKAGFANAMLEIECPDDYEIVSGGCACTGTNGVLWGSGGDDEDASWACACIYNDDGTVEGYADCSKDVKR